MERCGEDTTMQALLGKITDIRKPDNSDGAPTAVGLLEVRFKAACVLPQRTRVPEWLKDPVLTVRRDALDAREIGEPGDSLILTPAESARWLSPLTVAPEVAYGKMPETLRLHLRWWKDEKLPE